MPRKKRKKRTLTGFAAFAIISSLVIAAGFLVLWSLYDTEEPDSFGIPSHLVDNVFSAYLPAFVATLVGFRDAIFHLGVSVGDEKKKKPVLIHQGAGILYATACVGLLSASGILVAISLGIDEDKAKYFIVGGGTVWAGTLGVVFSRYFKEYALADTGGAT